MPFLDCVLDKDKGQDNLLSPVFLGSSCHTSSTVGIVHSHCEMLNGWTGGWAFGGCPEVEPIHSGLAGERTVFRKVLS